MATFRHVVSHHIMWRHLAGYVYVRFSRSSEIALKIKKKRPPAVDCTTLCVVCKYDVKGTATAYIVVSIIECVCCLHFK